MLNCLTVVGCMVALIMHSNKKTNLGAFHLWQGLGLALAFIVLLMATNFIPYGLYSYYLAAGLSELFWVMYVLLVVLRLIASQR